MHVNFICSIDPEETRIYYACSDNVSIMRGSDTDDILFIPYNKKEIEPAYTSKYNYKHKKQVILLMITDEDNRWHYLAVKSLPALFRGITSSNNGDFYCLNCFHSYRTLNKLKKHERVCNNHDYCRVNMPKEHEKMKYLSGEK